MTVKELTPMQRRRRLCGILREEYAFLRGQGMPHVHVVLRLSKLYDVTVVSVEDTVKSTGDRREAFN